MDDFNIRFKIRDQGRSGDGVLSPQKIIESCRAELDSGKLSGTARGAMLAAMAAAFFSIENCQSALKYWTEAAAEFDKSSESVSKAHTLINIGGLYEHTMDFESAEYKYNEARAIFEKNGDPNGIALCSYKIGSMFFNCGDLHKALEHLLVSESMNEDSRDEEYQILKGNIKNKLGELHSKLLNFEDAKKFFFEAMHIYNYINHPAGIIIVMNNIGKVFMREGHLEEAETFFRDGHEHAKTGNDRHIELRYLLNLAELNARNGKFEDAYSFLTEYNNLRDSVFSQTLTQKITDIETRFEIKRKEQELEIYKLKNIDLLAANDIIKKQNDELTSAYQKMELLAETDPLTGLANRRKCLSRIGEEKLRFERTSTPFSLILLDVDFFKKFNDSYGHDFGDRILTEIAGLLMENTRRIDIPSRWGGEEFLILLPGTKIPGALVLAEKLREKVEANKKYVGGEEVFVTVTVGVAEYGADCTGIDDCIKKADEALYKGKNAGRNRVETL